MHCLNHDSPAPLLVINTRHTAIFNRPKRTTFTVKLVAALWFAAVLGGALLLEIHATTPGQQDAAPAGWPAASSIARCSRGPTLLVFVHPYCPCARTTLGELSAIMMTCPGEVAAQVVFVVAGDEAPNWAENELWQTARAIPRVQTLVDAQGREARRFGACTSGHTLLFDKHGKCVFAGGITASRGYAGDNAGRRAIVSYLAGGHSETGSSPTFGCPLFDDVSEVASERGL